MAGKIVTATDITLKAFDHARAEIIERLKMRDTALLAHVTVTLTFAGVYFGFVVKDLKPQSSGLTPLYFLTPLTLVLPLLSLIFAQIVGQHTRGIEDLAVFIRSQIGDKLGGEPHWDAYTNSGSADVQRKRTVWTRWKHVLVLHAPTLTLSLGSVAAMFGLFKLGVETGGSLFDRPSVLAFFTIGIWLDVLLFVTAIVITWRSFSTRIAAIKAATGTSTPKAEQPAAGSEADAKKDVAPRAVVEENQKKP